MKNKLHYKKKILNCKFLVLSAFVLFFITSFNVESYANSVSNIIQQIKNKKITLDLENKSVRAILFEIQKQGKVSFIYGDHKELDQLKKSIKVNNISVEETLNLLFANTDFSYNIKENSITIIRKQAPSKSQNEKIRISGKVIDDNKKPVVGATILVSGTTNGAITDSEGSFALLMNSGEQIEASFVGFQPFTKVISNHDDQMIITLNTDAMAVEDVVVTGIFKRSNATFTGSATTVTGKELKQFGNRNVLASLRNIDPSLNIVENNSFGSDPNKLPEIQIRGNSSLPNVDQLQDEARDKARINMNTPLVILDGFESTLQQLIDMNDNEIETITILKDASATAIYGSRGANGVIVITSKAPAEGKLRISYRGDVSIEMPDLTSYSLLNARQKLELEKATGMYDRYSIEGELEGRKYYNKLLNEVNRGVNTDWLSKPLRTGVGHRHNIRLEGGDNVFRYSASVQYNKIAGVMRGSDRNNFNGTINLSYRLKSVKFSNNLLIGLNSTNESPYGSFQTYASLNPYERAYDDNGLLIRQFGHPWLTPIQNPLYDAELNTYNKSKTTSFTNNFSVEWEIVNSLVLKGRVGAFKSIARSDLFYPNTHSKFIDNKYMEEDQILKRGEYTIGNTEDYNIDASVNMTYSRTFAEKHLLFAGVDYNIRESKMDHYSFTSQGFSNENMDMVSSAMQYQEGTKPTGSESITRSIGITANVNYAYDGRYYGDFSVRTDGSSAFGSKKRFAPFWAVGLGWNIHNEKFLKNSKVINNLKLRASAGINGSQQFSSYQALSTMKYFADDRYYNWMGAYLIALGNDNLTWQQKMNYNLGMDASFLNNRLTANIDVYKEVTNDLVSSVSLPSANGFSSYVDNIGKIENRGLELKLTGVLIRNTERGIQWSVTTAFIHNTNKIIEISEALKKAQGETESKATTNPNFLFREGYSENTLWVVKSLGIDPSTGREVYVDRYGMPTSKWDARDIADCGVSTPKYTGNINTTLRIKNIMFTASFGYRFGGQQYNSTLIDKVENANYNVNLDSRVYTDRWKKQDDKTQYKSIFVKETTYMTSRFVQDENTFTCQNINLTYEFNQQKIKESIGLENLNLSFSMSDLFYISTIKRERGTSYPFSRQMSITLNATF